MPDLKALVGFLPRLQAEGFSAGKWSGMEENSPGVMTMPWVDYSETASDFMKAAYDHGWVLKNFDWGEWQQTPEARALVEDPAALGRASATQLARLLTIEIRRDRFVEGALLSAFESGLILAIVKRAEQLLKKKKQAASAAGSKSAAQ